jgi:hypothetical protein
MIEVTRALSVTERSSQPTLVFYRAAGETIRVPDDVVSLLNREGVETGILQARNPVTHDQWWVPVLGMAKTGVPYAIALAAVIRTWLKERKGRQVKLENGRLKISADTPSDVERLLSALTKHEKKLGSLHVTKAKSAAKVPVKRAVRKRSDK